MHDHIPTRIPRGEPVPIASMMVGFRLALEMAFNPEKFVKATPVSPLSPSQPVERVGGGSQLLLFK